MIMTFMFMTIFIHTCLRFNEFKNRVKNHLLFSISAIFLCARKVMNLTMSTLRNKPRLNVEMSLDIDVYN